MSDSVITIKHLKKYYGKYRGVEDVSLTINKGEIYGFIGPNGAGKSTTIRSILGLININKGEILINGKKLDINDTSVKENIGYLPSEVNLYKYMRVKEILDFHESFYKKNIHKRRNELVKLFKVDESKYINSLSLGNLKKVGIILALMHEPKILILDEATSGLDPIMQNTLHELLIKEKEKGTTILYSSHILSEVSNLCDRIGFIKDGVIIKEDSIDNILKNNYSYLIIKSNDIEKIKKDLKLELISECNGLYKFLNDMETNKLISKLSKYKIDKLFIEEVTLEDLFIKYYK